MSELLEYKCPACGGAITFDSSLQKMKCPYCDTEYDVETLQHYDEELQMDGQDDLSWQTNAGSEWQGTEQDAMNVYQCESCGGEIIGDETLAATKCPYCGNPVIMKGKLSGALRPDLVVPFQLDKNAAKNALFDHFEGKRLLPAVFKKQSHLDEVKGIYVPFWIFDADASANMRYKATKVKVWRDSRYQYREVSHYSVLRAGTLSFADVPADGSSKMPDELMQSLEPFDLTKAVDFQTAYLAGYLADKYDVSAEQCQEVANKRVKASTEDVFRETVTGYASVTPENSSIKLMESKTRYVLLPVWLLTTSWQGKNYLFAMNGQTGKFIGNLPLDKGAYLKWLAIVTAAAGIVTYLLAWLIHLLS